MTRQLFNQSWTVQERVSLFDQQQGIRESPRTVSLPHDALIHEPRSADTPAGGKNGYFPSKTYVYTKQFETPSTESSQLRVLEFDGVYRDAMVYINNNLAGQRSYGYSKFFVDATPFLQSGGPNEVRVESRAHLDSRWYTGAGIYRDVWLHTLNKQHFVPGTLKVLTSHLENGLAEIVVSGEIASTSRVATTPEITIQVQDESGAIVVKQALPITLVGSEAAPFWARLEISNPEVWSPENPHLYTVDAHLSPATTDGEETLDHVRVRFGVRTVSVQKSKGLLLNGNPIKLRGACVHHDNGPLGSASYFDAELRRVALLKNAGFNALRSSHNPMSEAFLDACDELGMLVLEEAFDVWSHGKTDHDYSLSFATDWEDDISSMVSRAFNHPSVIMYSIGNEIPEIATPSGAAWSRKLVAHLKHIDPTRPITNGINGFLTVLDQLKKKAAAQSPQETGERANVNEAMNAGDMLNLVSASSQVTHNIREASSVLDVVGLNYADSRYLLDSPDGQQPILLGTETFPPKISTNWNTISQNAHLAGDFTWTGWDYLGEVGIGRTRWADENQQFEAPYPWLVGNVGDFSITGTRRPISYHREAAFGLRVSPFIAVQDPENFGREALSGQWAWHDCEESWTWPGHEQRLTRVEVYSGAHEIELFLNDASLGRKPSGAATDHRTVFEVPYSPGELRADAFVDGHLAGSQTLRTAQSGHSIRVSLCEFQPPLHNGGLAYFDIVAIDETGALNPTVASQIEVVSTYGGDLLALANDNPLNEAAFNSTSTYMHKGRALAIVRVSDVNELALSVSEN